MLFTLKALASALLLSTAVFAAAVGSPEHLEKRAQPKGIDISAAQGNVNWKSVVTDGISFVYIQATEGISELDNVLVVRCTDISFQATRILTTPLSSPAPQKHTFFVAPTTWLILPSLLALFRPTSSSQTVEVGLGMASPSQVSLSF